MSRFSVLLITLCFFAAFNAIALENFYQSGTEAFHEENGTLEALQASLLMGGFFLYGISFLVGGERLSSALEVNWIIRGSALLCLSFFVREVDLETLSLPALLVLPWVGTGRTITLCMLWGLFIYTMARSQVNAKELLRTGVEQRVVACFAVAAALLCAGALFDRGYIGGDSARFFEELLETNAYLALMLPLYWLLSPWRQSVAESVI